MFGATFDGVALLRETGAVALTALAVRWMDDVVDGETLPDDDAVGCGADPVIARAVYSLLALALACALDRERAVTLFLCSYAVGMLGAGDARLPLGLSPRGESMAVLAVAFWAGGWALTAAALGTVLAIQVADDLDDVDDDARTGAANLACRLGAVEAAGAGLVGLVVACWIDPRLPVQAFVAVAAVQSFSSRFAPGRGSAGGTEPGAPVPLPGEGR